MNKMSAANANVNNVILTILAMIVRYDHSIRFLYPFSILIRTNQIGKNIMRIQENVRIEGSGRSG